MKHTEVSLRRPVTTVVVFVALALIGLIASRLLPLEKFPDIEFPGIFVQVPYEGSTPEEVESLITRPIEEALATLTGVERMFSSSSENMAQISKFGGGVGVYWGNIRARGGSIRGVHGASPNHHNDQAQVSSRQTGHSVYRALQQRHACPIAVPGWRARSCWCEVRCNHDQFQRPLSMR